MDHRWEKKQFWSFLPIGTGAQTIIKGKIVEQNFSYWFAHFEITPMCYRLKCDVGYNIGPNYWVWSVRILFGFVQNQHGHLHVWPVSFLLSATNFTSKSVFWYFSVFLSHSIFYLMLRTIYWHKEIFYLPRQIKPSQKYRGAISGAMNWLAFLAFCSRSHLLYHSLGICWCIFVLFVDIDLCFLEISFEPVSECSFK